MQQGKIRFIRPFLRPISSGLNLCFKRYLRFKPAVIDPVIKEAEDNRLISEMKSKIKQTQVLNPRRLEAEPAWKALENVSDEVRVAYDYQRENLLLKFLRPTTVVFRTFCDFVKTKDELVVLKDLVQLIYWSKKQLDEAEVHHLFKTFVRLDSAEQLVEMLLQRNEYCLLPRNESLLFLMNHFKNKCLASFDLADAELFSKTFTNLVQIIPLFYDYDYPIPGRAYEMLYQVGSTGVVEALELSEELAQENEGSKKVGSRISISSLIHLAKGHIVGGDKVLATKWIEKLIKASEEADPDSLTKDTLFMVNLLKIYKEKILTMQDSTKVQGEEQEKSFVPSDSVELRGETVFIKTILDAGLNSQLCPEDVHSLNLISKRERLLEI